MEIRARGPFRDVEQLPDLRMFESFDVVEHDHRALPRGERLQGLREPRPQFAGLGGIPERRGDRLGEFVGVAHLAAARDVERGVGDDPVQPGTERLVRQEPVDRLERVEERLIVRPSVTEPTAVNDLKADLAVLWYADKDGKICTAKDIAAGKETSLTRVPDASAAGSESSVR